MKNMKKLFITLAMVAAGMFTMPASAQNVYYQKYDEVAADSILGTILSNYNGQPVMIDIWATWCPPCKMAHKEMNPVKPKYMEKGVHFAYITSTTSPADEWNGMIGEIKGDHYYVTEEQLDAMMKQVGSDGFPTYLLYDKNGKLQYKSVGYRGLEDIQGALDSVVGK